MPDKRGRKMAGEDQLAFASEVTDNTKTGPVSATFAAQQSCPDTCPLRNSGCYAESGPLGWITTRMNRAVQALELLIGRVTPEMIAQAESDAIDTLTGKRDMRIHVVGDAITVESVKLLAAAAARYIAKFGKRVWTYTHAWRLVDRKWWGSISVIASCDNVKQLQAAHDRGYATAVVVKQHESPNPYMVGDFRVVPCLEQTGRAKNCVSCGLCMNADLMHKKKITVAFETHGAREATANRSLDKIQAIMNEAMQIA